MIDYNDKDFRNAIVKAVNDDKLIIFVGAGISRLCGLPSWDDASNHLLNYCTEICKDNFTYAHKEKIISNVKDAKEKITIGYYLLNKVDPTDKLWKNWLKKEFSLNNKPKDEKLLEKQNKMRNLIYGLSSIVFSTNVDLLLDKQIPIENRFFSKKHLQNIKIIQNLDLQIWHLHGSLDRSSEVVFTTRQYLERYTNEEFRRRLYNLLNNGEYTILFIGYGLSELQLLDFLVNAKGDGTRMFLLQPYFKDDEALYEAERPYFKDYGISLIKYPKDHGYDELFHVLEELKNEVINSSGKPTEKYSILENTFRTEPNKDNKAFIKRNINCLSDKLKCNLIHSIGKNERFSSEWFAFLTKDVELKHLFNTTNDLKNTCSSKDNEPLNIKYLRFLLNEFANKKSEKLFGVSKRKVKELLIRLKNEKELFNNKQLIYTLLKIIFCDERFLNLKDSVWFLSNCFQDDKSESWMAYSAIDSNKNLLKTNTKTKKKLIKLAVTDRMKSDKYMDYHFEAFFHSFGNDLAKELPDYVFNLCFNSVKKEVNKEKFSRYNIMGDCFEMYANKEGPSLSNEDDIIRWMLLSIPSLTNDKLVTIFNSCVNSTHLFEKRLSIYLCNLHFESMRNLFFEHLTSFSSMPYYSEVYSLVFNNVSLFNESELGRLYAFVSSASFDSKHLLVDVACKADFCTLLEKRKPVFAQLKIGLLSKLDKDELNQLPSLRKPLDRSKLAYIGPIETIEKDDKILKDILNNSQDDFLNLCINLDKTKPNFDVNEVTIIDNFKDIYTKLNLSSLDYESVSKFPISILNCFISSLASDAKVSLERKLKILNSLINDSTKSDQVFYFLESLYLFYLNKNINKEDCDRILEVLSNFNALFSSSNWIFNESSEYQSIFSVQVFYPLSLLLSLLDENNWNKFKSFFEKRLSDDKTSTMAKAIVIYNLNKLLVIDPDWVESKIDTLFDNIIQGHNLSFYLFSYSCPLNSQFVMSLASKNILVPLLNSNEFSQNSYIYLEHLLVRIIQQVLPKNLKQYIYQAKSLSDSLYFLLKEVQPSFLQKRIY